MNPLGENESTVFPDPSTRLAVGEPPLLRAILILFTPAVTAYVPDAEPRERCNVYDPVENTTA